MANKTAKSDNKAASSSAPEDRYRSGRTRFSFMGFGRGQNREWYFSGQLPGEEVVRVVRKHWWFLVQPGLPLLGCTVAFLVLIWAAIVFPEAGGFWLLLEGAAFIGMLVTGGWFIYKDFVRWWYEAYIITDRRIVEQRGLLQPTRQQTGLDKVQQVGLDIKGVLGLFLGFGTIHVYLTGGDFYIRDVPHPRKVRDALLVMAEELASKKKKEEPPPKPKDPTIADVLEKLSKEKEVSPLPDADEHLPPLRNSERFRGPRRTFGGILRVPCNVRYVSGEYTVKYIQRSQYVLLRNMMVPILLVILLFPLALLGPGIGLVPDAALGAWWIGSILIIVGLLISMVLIWSNYGDDVYILTNRRIIDIERFFFFFAEKHQETEYKNIRDVKVTVSSVMQRFLDVGNVFIETPGAAPNIVLENVDHPFVLQDEISGIRTHKEKADAAAKENKDKKNLYTWFSQVVTTLEKTAEDRGTPNLRDMDLLTAMARAQEYDLDVVVSGEAMDNPHIPPGCVVSQNPPPGTLMKKESKIEVVLSRRKPASVENLW